MQPNDRMESFSGNPGFFYKQKCVTDKHSVRISYDLAVLSAEFLAVRGAVIVRPN